MKTKAKDTAFIAMCVFFVAVSAENITAQKGKFYVGAGVGLTKIGGFNNLVGELGNTATGWNFGDPIFIEYNAKTVPEIRLGYILPDNKGSLDATFILVNAGEMTKVSASAGQDIWTAPIINPDYFIGVSAMQAWHDIEFTLFDFEYTKNLISTSRWFFAVSGGIRYIDLDNELRVNYIDAVLPINAVSSYSSNLVGPKVALTAKSNVVDNAGFMAKATFAVLGGRENYSLVNIDPTGPSVVTSLQASDTFKVQPITEVELGVFYSPWESFMLNLGYRASVWFDAIRQIEFVDDYVYYNLVRDYNLTMMGFIFSATLFFG